MTQQVSKRQKRLSVLLKSTDGPIRASDVMSALGVSRQKASGLLAGWNRQGVIRRVAQGLYVPISPFALGQTQVLENPWVLVPELYEPGYVGGWSALEYWGLTEQLFRSVCVLTNKRTSYGNNIHQGIGFYVKYIPLKKLYGTKTLWQDGAKIQISDPHKTILDIVDDPNLGAGLQHTIDCLVEYKSMNSEPGDQRLLLDYAQQAKTGASFKKLGYLAEKLEYGRKFVDECQKNLSKGYAYLDKTSQRNKLVTRWRLWVPEALKENDI
jgi:predicted transcriptional regulator of viral defense system